MSANGTWSSDLYGLYCIVGGFAAALGALASAARATVPRLELNASHASALGRTAIVGVALVSPPCVLPSIAEVVSMRGADSFDGSIVSSGPAVAATVTPTTPVVSGAAIAAGSER